MQINKLTFSLKNTDTVNIHYLITLNGTQNKLYPPAFQKDLAMITQCIASRIRTAESISVDLVTMTSAITLPVLLTRNNSTVTY